MKDKKQEKNEPAEPNKPVESVDQTAEINELKDLLQRTQANFENFRKQTEKRTAEIKGAAAKSVILQLLPIIDNFQLALNNSKDEAAFKEGVELIYAQLSSLLESNKVEAIKTEGNKFDPYLHEALLKVDSDHPEGTIVEELQKGFILNGEVIRHAKVKISSGLKTKDTTKKNINENEI